ncbi:IS200/IS605 family transposase [Aphanothece hegewaldii CCALA 016]|uniref:IS200/IS605 family transposase n=1 Tax=Aphanothece hegewaldii CCALA 016 TaxID=2107694 RepID=A0A2T1LRC8_9CHRO|nr:IS200/IS605 family transposase [Aphanothece hegewaldii]PSF30577.1 IS200/IS605 family transposase [Aphanothece hegewaldii CCALA 016]
MDKKGYKSSSRSVSDLKAHLVLVTKYRRKVINQAVLEDLVTIAKNLGEKWGVEIIEINGEADHLHILFGYYPQMQLSKFVNNLKTVTSRLINKNHAEYLKTFYWKDSVLWTSSYFIASCGGVTVEKLKQYVESQNSPSET